MTKLHIMSDIHLEFGPFDHNPPECDIVVIAGDCDVGSGAFPWLADTFPSTPVVYVAGNHEFYGGRIHDKHIKDMKDCALGHGICFLENEIAIIGGVRFIGATLWTDFELNDEPERDAYEAKSGMNDFRHIKSADGKLITPYNWIDWNAISKEFIENELWHNRDQTVVVTHHSPSRLSRPPYYKGDPVSAAYHSKLEHLILDHQPDLWVHGHIHENKDYNIGKTRIVCNPRGYYGHALNPKFDENFIVEI